MADEVYDGAIGIDLGMLPHSQLRDCDSEVEMREYLLTPHRHHLLLRCQL